MRTLELADDAGFDIVRSEVVSSTGPDGEPERFLWVVALRGTRMTPSPGPTDIPAG